MITLTVDLADRSYPIYIGEDLLGNEDLLLQHIPGKNVLVVSNNTVAPLYLDKTLAMLASKQVETCILPDGEEYKNLETLNTSTMFCWEKNSTAIPPSSHSAVASLARWRALQLPVTSAAYTWSRYRPLCLPRLTPLSAAKPLSITPLART